MRIRKRKIIFRNRLLFQTLLSLIGPFLRYFIIWGETRSKILSLSFFLFVLSLSFFFFFLSSKFLANFFSSPSITEIEHLNYFPSCSHVLSLFIFCCFFKTKKRKKMKTTKSIVCFASFPMCLITALTKIRALKLYTFGFQFLKERKYSIRREIYYNQNRSTNKK